MTTASTTPSVGARPHPHDPGACWSCWDWEHGITWAVVHEADDGTRTWADVVCPRCNGTGREPVAHAAPPAETPGDDEEDPL